MSGDHRNPSPTDIAMEVGGASVGLGIITMTLFPFVIAPLALVIAPLALIGLVAALMATLVAAPLVLVFRLARRLLAYRSADTAEAGPASRIVGGRRLGTA